MLPLPFAWFGLLARVHNSAGFHVQFNFTIQPIIALVAGLLILVRPKLLNFIVAFYLIAIGILGLLQIHW